MRILFVTENFPPETNASATRVSERAEWWVRQGHEVTVVTCFPNFPDGKLFPGYRQSWRRVETLNGVRVVRVRTFIAPNDGIFLRVLDFLSFLVTGFVAGIAEPRSDVVIATSPQLFAAMCGWLVGAARRRPFIFELGDLWPASITAVGAMSDNFVLRAVEKLELFLYRRSAAVAALSPAFKDDLVRRGIPPGKIAVVLNGVDTERYSPADKDVALARSLGLGGKFVVGYIGTHGAAHGLSAVLDAAERLGPASDVAFLFVGTGAAKQKLVRDAQARGLDNVRFVPSQPKERVAAYWSVCDAALVSLIDSPVMTTVIPSKVFEAMGVGLPVILAAPPGEASRIVEGHEIGLHLPPEDGAALAECAIRLRDDPALRARLAANSLAAAPLFSRERQSRRMIALCEIVASGDGGRAAELVELATA